MSISYTLLFSRFICGIFFLKTILFKRSDCTTIMIKFKSQFVSDAKRNIS